MRPWLVVVGMLFLTLAAGTVAALYLAGTGSSTPSTTFNRPPTFPIAPNETEALPISGTNGTSEQLNLSWVSTGPIQFVLQSPAGCAGTCWKTSTIASWPSNTSGTWAGSGPFHYPLQCLLKNFATRTANVTLTARATSTNPTPPSLEFDLIVGAGASALFGVGGLAVFLGFFLRGDPYGPQPALVSRSAEDVEELARDEQLRH